MRLSFFFFFSLFLHFLFLSLSLCMSLSLSVSPLKIFPHCSVSRKHFQLEGRKKQTFVRLPFLRNPNSLSDWQVSHHSTPVPFLSFWHLNFNERLYVNPFFVFLFNAACLQGSSQPLFRFSSKQYTRIICPYGYLIWSCSWNTTLIKYWQCNLTDQISPTRFEKVNV